MTAFELKAHGRQATHKVNQLHHRVFEPRQGHVSGTEGRAESETYTRHDTKLYHRPADLPVEHYSMTQVSLIIL